MTKSDALNRLAILEQHGLLKEAEAFRLEFKAILKPEVPELTSKWLARFITQDKDMLELKHKVGKLANQQDCALIMGPTGTGKELIAHALHGDRSEMRNGKDINPFIGINCAGLPSGLIESELFGHSKGAFTGAYVNKEGLFQMAGNGTVFLDEVGELPMDIQAKLLRAIQEREVRPVGSTFEARFNARIVCATLKDLDVCVAEGKFREDLLYRINTFTLKVTPLSERPDDVPLILNYIASKYEEQHSVDPADKFPRTHRLNANKLKGNVREIEQIVRRYHVWKELPE